MTLKLKKIKDGCKIEEYRCENCGRLMEIWIHKDGNMSEDSGCYVYHPLVNGVKQKDKWVVECAKCGQIYEILTSSPTKS